MPDRAWHSWHYDDDTYGRQAGGYMVNFQEQQMSGHFAFVTAHACGHEVGTAMGDEKAGSGSGSSDGDDDDDDDDG